MIYGWLENLLVDRYFFVIGSLDNVLTVQLFA